MWLRMDSAINQTKESLQHVRVNRKGDARCRRSTCSSNLSGFGRWPDTCFRRAAARLPASPNTMVPSRVRDVSKHMYMSGLKGSAESARTTFLLHLVIFLLRLTDRLAKVAWRWDRT